MRYRVYGMCVVQVYCIFLEFNKKKLLTKELQICKYKINFNQIMRMCKYLCNI